MRKILLVVGVLAMACNGEDKDSASDAEDAVAADLWGEIDGYSSWGQVAPWTDVQPSVSVHGSFVQIWVNSTGAAAAEAGGTDFPEGTILVKEGYDAEDGAPVAVTAMWKGAGSEATGGWYFARYSASGDIEMSGDDAAEACGGCHSAGPDYSLAWSAE